MGALVLFALGGMYWHHLGGEDELVRLKSDYHKVKTEISKLGEDAERVEEFKEKTETLERKKLIIERLKRQKVGPAKMLSDLAVILTQVKRVWLTAVLEKDGKLILEGGAMQHEDISEFQLGLEQRSNFFTDVELGNVVNAEESGGVRYLNWTIACVPDFSAG